MGERNTEKNRWTRRIHLTPRHRVMAWPFKRGQLCFSLDLPAISGFNVLMGFWGVWGPSPKASSPSVTLVINTINTREWNLINFQIIFTREKED